MLKVDITQRIHDKHFTVLSNDPLLGARRSATLGSRLGCGRARGGSGSGNGSGLLATATTPAGGLLAAVFILFLLGVALLHPAHLTVHGDEVSVFIFHHLRWGRRGRRSGNRGRGGVDAWDVKVLPPSGMAGKFDVTLDELALALPAHVQGQVVGCAAGEEEDARDGGAQAGAVTVVVVLGALPRGEAVAEKMVVAVAHRATEDVCDDG